MKDQTPYRADVTQDGWPIAMERPSSVSVLVYDDIFS